MGRILRGMVAVVLIPLLAHAGPPPRPPPPPPPTPPPASDMPPPPPPPPPAAVECFPACRPGFFCYQGQCRSACNPPCAAGETCMDNGQCVVGDGQPPPPPPPEEPVGPPPPAGLMVSDDGEQAPPGYHWETKRRKGMLIAGPVLLGVGWFMSIFYGLFGFLFAGIGLSSSSSSTSWIVVNKGTYLIYLVPVGGPAAAQFLMATSFGYRDGAGRTLELAWMAIVSALQVSGLTLTILGIPTSQVLVEDRRANADSPLQDGLRVGWAPGAPGAQAGFSLLGNF